MKATRHYGKPIFDRQFPPVLANTGQDGDCNLVNTHRNLSRLMSCTYTWTIGSSTSCDIVVDLKTVSSEHCRVSRVGHECVIEDLDSTNGTFVNGHQINRRTTFTESDHIRLGQTVELSWSQISDLSKRRVITIGRALDNHVVLDLPNVSARHARILLQSDRLIIEDLGSTNGTALGTVQNKIHRDTLDPNGMVYFGSTPVSASKLLFGVPRADCDKPNTDVTPDSRRWIAWSSVVGMLLVGAVVVAVLLATSNRLSDGNHVSEPEQGSTAALAGQSNEREDSSSAKGVLSDAQLPRDRQAANSPTKALFWVTVSNQEGDQVYRLGTAWAVSPRLLVTSANVLSAARTLMADGYPIDRVYSPVTGQSIAIRSGKAHDIFRTTASQAIAARTQYESTLRELESDVMDDAAIDAAKKTLLNLRQRGFDALERQAAFDVAVLEIEQPVEAVLAVADNDSSLRPKKKVSIFGLAFDLEDPFLEPNTTTDAQRDDTRIHQLTSHDDQNTGFRRLCVECERNHVEYNFAGSPILNEQGEVVAMYSRPTPNADPEQPPSGDTCDAALASCIQEFVARFE